MARIRSRLPNVPQNYSDVTVWRLCAGKGSRPPHQVRQPSAHESLECPRDSRRRAHENYDISGGEAYRSVVRQAAID